MAVYLIECDISGDQYTAVQKQNLDLGQVTLRLRIGKLWTKRQLQSKLWNKNVFINITVQTDIMTYKTELLF